MSLTFDTHRLKRSESEPAKPRSLGRLVGRFVTATIEGGGDARQGWVKSTDPLILTGQSGTDYKCEGEPVIVVNPPVCPGCNDTGWQPLTGCPGAYGECHVCHNPPNNSDQERP